MFFRAIHIIIQVTLESILVFQYMLVIRFADNFDLGETVGIDILLESTICG